MFIGKFPYAFSPEQLQAGVNATVDPAITNPIPGQLLPLRTMHTFSSHWTLLRLASVKRIAY